MAIQMGGNEFGKNPAMKKNHPPQLALSNRCIETAAQINQVLQVVSTATAALANFSHRSYSMFEQPAAPPAPDAPMTEGQIALENTLRAACERMDKILTDEPRWSDEFQRKVEKDYDELHALQMAAIAQQKAAADEVTSPHFRYRPDLKRLVDGRWMAVLGDVQHLEFAVYGIGDSAQLALEDFDSVFLKGVPASVFRYAQHREQALDSGQQPQPFPNQEQTHEKNNDDENLDSPGNNAGGGPSTGR